MAKRIFWAICSSLLLAANANAADETVNFCKNTGDYVTYSNAISIPAGKTYDVITSRYSYWTSTVTGKGTMNIRTGGERCFLGTKNGATYPAWTGFSGDVHIYPYKSIVSNAGFYGLIWGHGGKTFNPEEPEASIRDGKVNNCFANNKVIMHSGTVLASESGNRGIRIAHLDMEAGSQLYGYYKSSNTPKSYYVVGCDNTDALLAGRISPMSDNLQEAIGLIKEGTGTYRITGNTNNICGGLRVLDGKVLVNNDAAKAKSGKLSGGTGHLYKATDTGVFVMQSGTIGGTGSIASVTDVYGTIEPGDNGIGNLTFQDFAKGNAVTLRLRPSTRIKIEISSADSYDRVTVNGPVEYYNIGQDFAQSTRMPKVQIILREDAEVKAGDSFTILTAKSKKSLNSIDWNWDIVYPEKYTWEVSEVATSTGISLVATVTSLADGNQNTGDNEEDDKDEEEREEWDYAKEKLSTSPLRNYAIRFKKYIGVAVRGWTMDLNNDNDAQVALIRTQFNAVVAENEMKFDAVEPSQGTFAFGDGDKLVNFASRNNCRVRGHCLAWHNQVPGWLTSDGTKNSMNRSRKELLDILKNHITKVVGRWKGKVKEWDVVNEVLDDNQSAIRSNPDAYTLRPSIWSTGIGEDFIDSAFVWAHQADPNAILILNDYDVEFQGQAKTEAMFNLVKRLRKSGIPINGVGLQCHLDAGKVNVSRLKANMQRYADLGMVCNITELDLGIDNTSDEQLMKQADDYFAITRAAMTMSNCTSVMIWGLKDNESWRSSNPLIFTSSLSKKPAYWGVHAAVNMTYKDYTTGMENVSSEENRDTDGSSANGYYDLTGRKVCKPEKGLYISNGKKYFITR